MFFVNKQRNDIFININKCIIEHIKMSIHSFIASDYKIEAVITDLDGTLLRTDNTVSKLDFETLLRLGDLNILRIVATGRTLMSVMQVFTPDSPLDYLIFSNGLGIYDMKSQKIIRTHHIPKTDVEVLAKQLCSFKADFQIKGTIPNCHTYLYKQHSEYNSDLEVLNSRYANFCKEFKDDYQLTDASRIICFTEDIADIERIAALCPNFDIIRATSPINNQTIWVEIYPPGVNKGSAVVELCEMHDISLRNTAGLGNDYNDIHFLECVGNPYLVANAPDDLKKRFNSLSGGNEHNPLSELVAILNCG